MNLIDLIIVALFGYGIIKGYNKGLIIELSSFFGIFISFFISTNLDDIISKQIVELVNIYFDIVIFFNINFNIKITYFYFF